MKLFSYKNIQFLGISLFAIGFAALISMLFVGSFTLTKDNTQLVIKDSAHFSSLNGSFEKIYNSTYTSKHQFIQAIEGSIEQVNNEFKKNEQWDKVIYNDYTLSLVKKSFNWNLPYSVWTWFLICFILPTFGAIIYIVPLFNKGLPGIKNDRIFQSSWTNGKWLGIFIGSFLILFYIFLYKLPSYLIQWIALVDPLSEWLSGGESSQWFLYGLLYTLSMLTMGIRMFSKYRHSKYHQLRTASLLFFQLIFAFLIPNILSKLNMPSADLKNIWPLDYTFFFDYHLNDLISKGTIGFWFLGWGIALFVLVVPIMVYFFGKRWYCSWVCGCGGLAETVGDPFRQLSNKSLKAWKIERITVHSVLVYAVIMTGAVLYTYWTGSSDLFGFNTYSIRENYGFFVGFILAGVVGTGFYPFMGNRVWCRFACPLAAYLGIIQRFKSRFQITSNGSQCISCGNCSTYCEMGIDVRAYAQKGEPIVRASCVGCGVCAAVCPRGVLKLENLSK